MQVFQVVIALLLGGAALAAVARRIGAPYPALVALAGAALALIPGVPTLVLDPAGEMTYVSPSAARVLQLPAEELNGQSMATFIRQHVHPDDAATFSLVDGEPARVTSEAGSLDVGDLVLHSFRLLRTRPHVRQRLADRHRHVLVDELQDASFAQGLLLRLLAAGAAGRVTAVADDDLVVRRVDGRLGVIAPPEPGSMTATQPIALLRGSAPDLERIRDLIERCSQTGG